MSDQPSRQTVMIGTPAGDGRVNAQYVQSLLASQRLLDRQGIGMIVHFVLHDSLVMQARNATVAAFLASDASDLVFIDSDIAWKAEDLARLLSHDVPMVAGAYRRKAAEVSFTVQFADGTAHRDRALGLIAARRVGTGFLRLRRDCLIRMIAAYPQLRYTPAPVFKESGDRYALFDTSLREGEFVGEDYTFCDRWRDIGGALWLDPEISLEHIGGHASYGGSLWQILTPTKG